MRDGLTTQPSRKLRIGQRGERLGDLGRLDLVVVDDQPLEQRLVPLAAQVAGSGDIGALAIGEQVERLAERVLDVARAGFERMATELPKEMPSLLQRAEAADEHWVGRVPALEDSSEASSFRGLYAIAYRRHSAIAHPTLMGLNPAVVDLANGRRRVQIEQRDPDMHGPFGLGSILLGFSLFISGYALGWPSRADVETAFE